MSYCRERWLMGEGDTTGQAFPARSSSVAAVLVCVVLVGGVAVVPGGDVPSALARSESTDSDVESTSVPVVVTSESVDTTEPVETTVTLPDSTQAENPTTIAATT